MFAPEQHAFASRSMTLILLVLACADAVVTPEQQSPSSVQGPPLEPQGPAWRPVASRLLRDPSEEAPELAALRRKYGPTDMRFGECALLGSDGTITGTACRSGCVVFGPYASAPPRSTVHVDFELVARDPLDFSSDMISDLELTRGRFAPQHLAAGEARKMGYEVYLADAAKALETRIWIHSDKPVSFEIKSLSVRVQ